MENFLRLHATETKLKSKPKPNQKYSTRNELKMKESREGEEGWGLPQEKISMASSIHKYKVSK